MCPFKFLFVTDSWLFSKASALNTLEIMCVYFSLKYSLTKELQLLHITSFSSVASETTDMSDLDMGTFTGIMAVNISIILVTT